KAGFGALRISKHVSLIVLAFSLASGVAEAQPGDEEDSASKLGPLDAGTVPVPVPPADMALPEVDTIISDEEFNAAIPSLDVASDPELETPLESIEAFER